MADRVDPQVVDGVTGANFKVIAESAAVSLNIATQNLVTHQQSMQQIDKAITAKSAELIMTTDISESGGLVAMLQQLLKGAQTTLPQTGSGC